MRQSCLCTCALLLILGMACTYTVYGLQVMAIGQAIYGQPGAPGPDAAAGAGSQGPAEGGKSGDNVVDAEFTDSDK